MENGVSLWKVKDDSFEMNYFDFIDQIKEFGTKFFSEMDIQIELTVAKEWGDIKVDKTRLVEEHKERKVDFYKKISFLEQGSEEQTDWTDIEELYNRMTNEI